MRNLWKSGTITEIANRENLPLQVVQLDVNSDISVEDAISKIIESPYMDLIERTMKGFGVLMDNSSPPKLVAKAILDAITSKDECRSSSINGSEGISSKAVYDIYRVFAQNVSE